jgi:hypothetical protein
VIGYNLDHTGINGAGIDKTVIEMKPHTSTRSGLVPTARGTTNQLSLLQAGGSPHLSNFTLRGTEQGHLYNGLRIGQASDARISNVKVTSVPGNDHMPPGETFGINDWRTTGSVYTGVEVDGGGVGAAGFGANSTRDITIRNSYFHDNPHSIGATFWQTNGITLEDVRSTNNRGGLNFERVSGSVRIVRPVLGGNSDSDLSFGSDQASAKVTIIDPKTTSGGKLRIRIYGSYNGPNKQQRSDIKVLVNGVDRTAQLVQWI